MNESKRNLRLSLHQLPSMKDDPCLPDARSISTIIAEILNSIVNIPKTLKALLNIIVAKKVLYHAQDDKTIISILKLYSSIVTQSVSILIRKIH